MAISKVDSLASWAEIIAWMQSNLVPDFLQSVSVDETDNTLLNCVGIGGQLLLQMKMSGTKNLAACYICYSDDSNTSIAPTQTGNTFRWAAVCSNGALMRFSYKGGDNVTSGSYTFALLFTKNNLNKSTVVVTSPANAAPKDDMKGGVYVAAEGDNPGTVRLTFTPRQMDQTQLIEFASTPVQNVVSYTPNAFYIQCGNYYDNQYTNFISNSATYITNGCWAIKD
jgi:hypothetical protein